MKPSKRNPSGRLSREQWLTEALDALFEEGPRILTVESISRRLGVSRGSFYWHFEDRNDFIRRLAEYWERTRTLDVGMAVEQAGGSPEDRLLRLMEMIQETYAAAYDVAVRAWASHEPRAAEIVRRVDRYRFRLVRSLFAEIGFTGDELEMRARTFYVFNSFDAGVSLQETSQQRMKRLKLRHEFFVKR